MVPLGCTVFCGNAALTACSRVMVSHAPAKHCCPTLPYAPEAVEPLATPSVMHLCGQPAPPHAPEAVEAFA